MYIILNSSSYIDLSNFSYVRKVDAHQHPSICSYDPNSEEVHLSGLIRSHVSKPILPFLEVKIIIRKNGRQVF